MELARSAAGQSGDSWKHLSQYSSTETEAGYFKYSYRNKVFISLKVQTDNFKGKRNQKLSLI
jgi:hypothetical protein